MIWAGKRIRYDGMQAAMIYIANSTIVRLSQSTAVPVDCQYSVLRIEEDRSPGRTAGKIEIFPL